MRDSSQATGFPRRYFYHRLPYGSESQFGPLNVLLNEGLDILQLESRDRRLHRFDFSNSARNVARSLANPGAAIAAYGGWGQFVRHELLPLSAYRNGGAQWVPNYQAHMVGMGMVSARLAEYYEEHGVPAPWLAAAATSMAAHLLNEILENDGGEPLTADAVADIYVFDVAGMLLFRAEPVRRFFADHLRLTSWGLQPVLRLPEATVENTGHWYALRMRVPGTRSWSLFHLMGMGGLGGISRDLRDGRAVTLGLGLATKEVTVVDSATHRQSVVLAPQAALFYDRNNSLLASAWYRSAGSEALSVNLYPGVLRVGRAQPGLWLQTTRSGGVRFGVTTRVTGVGVGW